MKHIGIASLALVTGPLLLVLTLLLGFNYFPPVTGDRRVADRCLSAVLAVAMYFVGRAFSTRSQERDDDLRRAVRIGGLIAAATVLAYLALVAGLTEVPEGTSKRIRIGLVYSQEFHDLLPDNSNNITDTKGEFNYDPNQVYQPWSVIASTVLVTGSWMLMFGAWSFFLVSLDRFLRRLQSAVDVGLQHGSEDLTRASTTRGQLERTIKARIPQLDMAVWRQRTTAIEGQICRVEIDGNAAGTGFLVGPDAVMTNYHVVEALLTNDVDPKRVQVRFDYKALASSSRVLGVVVSLHPTAWNLDSSPYAECETAGGGPGQPGPEELDYALLRLDRSVGLEDFTPDESFKPRRRGWSLLPDRLPQLELKAPLIIVQHPDGTPLKLAIDTEAYLGENSNDTRIRYTTNTMPGSSGSPVFSLDWKLVALHHLGDPAFNNLAAEFNQGVPINVIRRRIVDVRRPESVARTQAISVAPST